MHRSNIKLFGVLITVGALEASDTSSNGEQKETSGEATDNTVDNGSTSTKHEKEKQVSNLDAHGSPRKKARKTPQSKLICPRCHSSETKFCYYNNNRLSQPRHLCNNCQRFWTEGGRLRDIPVGGARRKAKNSRSPQHHNLLINRLNLAQHPPAFSSSSSSTSTASSRRSVLMGEGCIRSSPAMTSTCTEISREGSSSGPPAPILPHLQHFHGVPFSCTWSPIRYSARTPFTRRDKTGNAGVDPRGQCINSLELGQKNYLPLA